MYISIVCVVVTILGDFSLFQYVKSRSKELFQTSLRRQTLVEDNQLPIRLECVNTFNCSNCSCLIQRFVAGAVFIINLPFLLYYYLFDNEFEPIESHFSFFSSYNTLLYYILLISFSPLNDWSPRY